MARRYRTTVNVDIDVDEVFDQLSDEQVQDEADRRKSQKMRLGLSEPGREDWFDLAEQMRRSLDDRLHFEVLLNRMMQMAGVPKLTIKNAHQIAPANPVH